MITPDAATCRKCERLANFLDEVKSDNPDYFCRPVPSFGEPDAGLLIVGLAPGMHGANATGRPFTGDYAGELLYQTLYKYGFSTAAQSLSADDGLQLLNCRITNAVRCLPPQNKPVGAEVNNCNDFLAQELAALPPGGVIIALGTIAHKAVIRALGKKQKEYPFAHAACHELDAGKQLLDSYHCSRYNTQTRRLTTEMFEDVFRIVKELLGR
ncbi:uracil-DNA glycosylase [Solemya elarraichensis gill symbiont]|uniref:Type-5 uracil-DNA glycosylase n=1 Tax=Solemya elarraichensis gill symbiont TaxID=1918949 RepID=A0A1T2LCJ6_9GAMM|nr:uracil-DNA glycosylase [Solemya elarraichensis gill symbiont]OOZ42811.1 SPO1 DNA polymerase [Solemya elarraichensis gill symbiont]